MKSHWTHAELLTALATPARRATDGVARALGLRAEGAEEPFAAEPEAVPAAPPLRPDPAWATAARGLVRPGWAPPPTVKRHVTPDAFAGAPSLESAATAPEAPTDALISPAATPTPMPLVAEDPFEPIGAHPVAQAEALSPSLGFEPLNHPLLRAQAPAARAVYEVGAPPPRAPWSTFDPDPFDDLAASSPPPGAPGSRTPGQAPALSRPEPSRPSAPAAAPPAAAPQTDAASLEFEPSATAPVHTPAVLTRDEAPTDLELLGDSFSDPFVAWRPGGPRAAPALARPDETPLPAPGARLPLHPAPTSAPPAASTMELQGQDPPRPVRLRDLGRAATPSAASPPARAATPPAPPRAPLDELFDSAEPELEALPEGPAFAPVRAVPARAAATSAPEPFGPEAVTPSPARLRPAAAPAPEDDAPATSPRPPATARPAPVSSPGLPAAPQAPQVSPPAAAGLDRDALEEAMTEVLRDAARQHGLEV